MTVYYNEIDPFAAQWLRNLIAKGEIADGFVDERSIEDVTPKDLEGYTQCHFFAGIGVWSRALRQAGWSDDRQVWTGSCPCPPFSCAGKKKRCPECGERPICHATKCGVFRCTACGREWYADERHLWPAFQRLIRKCLPNKVFGEQVAGKDGEAWLDVVSVTLELEGYAVGSSTLPACGFGAPHLRKRLYWVADSELLRYSPSENRRSTSEKQEEGGLLESEGTCDVRGMAKSDMYEHKAEIPRSIEEETGEEVRVRKDISISRMSRGAGDDVCSLANSSDESCERISRGVSRKKEKVCREGVEDGDLIVGHTDGCEDSDPDSINGFWRNADWLFCTDGKWRPVESGTFPLVDVTSTLMGQVRTGLEGMGFDPKDIKKILKQPKSIIATSNKNRAGRIKGYGNAIVLKQAQTFVEAYMDIEKEGVENVE